MILNQISYLDCIVFVIFLAPQLLIHVGLWQTARWVIGALPFLGMLNASTTVSVRQGKIFDSFPISQSIRSAGDSFPGLRD